MKLHWLLALCAGGGITPLAAADFGAAFPDAAALPLAAAIDDLPKGDRVIQGRIVEVCQKKGCWVMLEDAGKAARVMMREHAFSLPKDARGPALVFGAISKVELTAAAAAHLSEDAGGTLVAAEEYRIDASAVRLLDESGHGG